VAELGSWRLLVDGQHPGAWNMALDEAVLEAVCAGAVPPTLRLYQWTPACVSIGYGQKVAEFNLRALAQEGIELVRRPTGGRAVLHGEDITYCLCLPATHPVVAGGVVASYRRLAAGLRLGLARLQVVGEPATAVTGVRAPACFLGCNHEELACRGRKLVGSAQWRRDGGVLQHGSLPLSGDVGRIAFYTNLPADEQVALAERLRRAAMTLEEAAGRSVSFHEVAFALAEGLAQALGIRWEASELTSAEKERAARLAAEKYLSEAWNANR
jgi:lipoate-protein ligase A